MARSAYDRMMDKVHFVPESGCWLFAGAWDSGGYGNVSTGKGKPPKKAHRISIEHHHGPMKRHHKGCHKCDTPQCVNPDHLRSETQSFNMREMHARGRVRQASLDNLKRNQNGTRS